ncbi:MAG: DUF3857 domain-containing protein [Cyclobacteriaceae bacterium]
MVRLFFAFFLMLLSGAVSAQERSMKFGKVSVKDLQMTEYQLDPEAEAVVLGDIAEARFRYNQERGFQLVFEHHIRIKILKKSGYEQADISIPLYRSDQSAKEVIGNIKGATYNLENGKMVKDKLSSSAIFEEQASNNWFITKFAMPNVKEGSIIEYTYDVLSDYVQHIREFEFQKSIPVVWSQYTVTTPEYFNYRVIGQGYHPFSSYETKPTLETFTYRWKENSDQQIRGTTVGHRRQLSNEYESKSTEYFWLAENIPAIRKEPFMTTIDDYNNKVGFQLVSTNFPGEGVKNIYNTYNNLSKTLMERGNFGKALERDNFLESIIALFNGLELQQKAVGIYEYLKHELNRDGIHTIFTQNSLKKTLDEKTGSVGDINLLLIAALRQAGMTAYPLILSTRSNGKPHPVYPDLQKLNYVVAFVQIGEKFAFADASVKGLPFGMLPTKCLNGKGWLVDEEVGKWVDLQTDAIDKKVVQNKISISESTVFMEYEIQNTKYEALDKRKTIVKDGEGALISDSGNNLSGWELMDSQIGATDSIYSPLTERYSIKEQNGDQFGGLLYIDPFIIGKAENPFNNDERLFPVDLVSKTERLYLMELEVPDGYIVEELPATSTFKLPNDGGSFSFSSSNIYGKISIVCKYSIDKVLFAPQEYPYLKEFFNRVVAKQSEQIVLRKST